MLDFNEQQLPGHPTLYKYGHDPSATSVTTPGGVGGPPGPSLSSGGGHAPLAAGPSHTHLNALGTVSSQLPAHHNNVSPAASLAVSGMCGAGRQISSSFLVLVLLYCCFLHYEYLGKLLHLEMGERVNDDLNLIRKECT